MDDTDIYIRPVDLGWTSLKSRDSIPDDNSPQGLTPYGQGSCLPRAMGGDGPVLSDSAVGSTLECLTISGSEDVPVDTDGLSNAFILHAPIPPPPAPAVRGKGLPGGIR